MDNLKKKTLIYVLVRQILLLYLSCRTLSAKTVEEIKKFNIKRKFLRFKSVTRNNVKSHLNAFEYVGLVQTSNS